MEKMILVDGNNWFRRRAEIDIVGQPVRSCYNEIQRMTGLVFCIWDGFKSLEKRRAIVPEYKVHRKTPGESIYENQDLLKKVLKLSKAINIQVNGVEGDDVIAHLAFKYREKYDVFIQSNDLDLYQLGCTMDRQKFPDKPHWIKLYKTMVGDPSDNIKGAAGFGKGGWEKLTDHDKQTLEAIITSGWGLTEGEVLEKVKPFLSPKVANWIALKPNLDLLVKYYKIVGFLPVSDKDVEDNMIVGINRPDLAEPIFKEFML